MMFADFGLVGAGLAPARGIGSRRILWALPDQACAGSLIRQETARGSRKGCPYIQVLARKLFSLVAHEDLVDHAVFLGCLGVHIEVTVEVALDPFGVLAGVLRQDVAQEVVETDGLARLDLDVCS